MLFAIGLFDAGFLGALCISLSTSWAVGEVFGWAHSLNKSVREAPWFYVVYLVMLLTSGAVVADPQRAAHDAITMFVQVVAVTLLPAALVFLILLLNDKPLMGEHVNTRWQNIANWTIVIFVIVMSTLFGVSVLFPEWFGDGRQSGGDAMASTSNQRLPKNSRSPTAGTRTIGSTTSPSC